MNILAIGAHPDDLELSCGGTLILHVQGGDDVFLMVITDGSMGGDPEIRRQEQLDAAKIIGAKDVFFGGYPDTTFECNRESIMKIESNRSVSQQWSPTGGCVKDVNRESHRVF